MYKCSWPAEHSPLATPTRVARDLIPRQDGTAATKTTSPPAIVVSPTDAPQGGEWPPHSTACWCNGYLVDCCPCGKQGCIGLPGKSPPPLSVATMPPVVYQGSDEGFYFLYQDAQRELVTLPACGCPSGYFTTECVYPCNITHGVP
jgi:hypothetical protein